MDVRFLMVRPTSPDTKERTAAAFVERLNQHQSDVELRKIQRYFKSGKGDYGEGDVFIGVRMGQVFALAKEFIELDSNEIETLLESPVHEVRAGALSIMDKQARRKRTPESRRKDLYHKATGGWLRAAGDVDRHRLVRFLDAHAAAMPRTMPRYAIEHFDKAQRDTWLRMKRDASRPTPEDN